MIRIYLVTPCLSSLVLSLHASEKSLPSSSRQPPTRQWNTSSLLSLVQAEKKQCSQLLLSSALETSHPAPQTGVHAVCVQRALVYLRTTQAVLHLALAPGTREAIEQMWPGKTKTKKVLSTSALPNSLSLSSPPHFMPKCSPLVFFNLRTAVLIAVCKKSKRLR